MKDCYAVLLDTVSIQNYIFRSNNLKENLGASYLVKKIYREFLSEALAQVLDRNVSVHELEYWKTSPDDQPNCRNGFEIGYIGGGNALLFFQDETKAKNFIKVWTKLLLVKAPGIITTVVCDLFPKETQKFRSSLDLLFNKLAENKNSYIPITSLPRHGITAECARSELSAEIYNSHLKAYVSADVNARLKAAEKAKDEIKEKYQTLLGDNYCFTDELDKLGGVKGEDSHIAIVHIDGNEIGSLFKTATDLSTIRKLSVSLSNGTDAAFEAIVKTTVSRYNEIMSFLGFKVEGTGTNIPLQDGKKILPLRPIIIGGDDITFVCDARLGIYFAKIFIEEFEKIEINGKKLTACAGISIIKTKYPFYRGYWLAEELCANAKSTRIKNDDSASYLDFHVSMGGIVGSLEEIRKHHFGIESQNGGKRECLLYRPFKVVPKEPFDEYSLDVFLNGARELQNLPKNKLAELRRVLTQSSAARREFIKHLQFRGMKLPRLQGYQYETELFQNNKTPYFDMLELLQFYPDFALQEIGESK